MFLREFSGGAATLLIEPTTLLALAEACRHAADATMEGNAACDADRADSNLFALLGAHLDALALICDLRADYEPRGDQPTIARVRRAWGVLRADRGAS